MRLRGVEVFRRHSCHDGDGNLPLDGARTYTGPPHIRTVRRILVRRGQLFVFSAYILNVTS